MRDTHSEIDFDIQGNAIWVTHFYEDEEFAFSVAYKDMGTANEAKRRWLVGTAIDFNDLTEVDRFREDVIVYE